MTRKILPALFAFYLRSADSNNSGAKCAFQHRKLTLARAVSLALKQNLNVQIANIETASKQQDRVIARSDLLPHAGFDANDAITRYNAKAQLGIQPSIIPHEACPFSGHPRWTDILDSDFHPTLIRQYQASEHRLLAQGIHGASSRAR